MKSIFSAIQVRKPSKNKFNLSHEKKMTGRMAELIPIYLQEVVPGDSFRVKTEILVRLNPLIAPIMHRVDVTTHYFFVPNRLIWANWEEFITGGTEGTSNPTAPYLVYNQTNKAFFNIATLADYFGIPTVLDAQTVTNPINISALPFAAYQKVYCDYYRDQTLQPETVFNLQDGDNSADIGELATLRLRCWEKDYFTSALPFAQRGPESLMPLEGTGSVTYLDSAIAVTDVGGIPASGNVNLGAAGALHDSANTNITLHNIDEVVLTNSGVSINDLRRSIRLQEWLEKNARGGARYVEQIMSHFGERSPDARLQRPEFLGGGRNPVIISEVLSTVTTEDPTSSDELPLGTMGGHGISFGRTNGFSKKFVEHGFVIGIMSVLPRTGYQQGINKQFSRFDRFDYYWPEFANIGEQEIKLKELYYNPAAAGTPEATFGYQSRYAEYKYTPGSTHGSMRDTLNFWHMNRIFGSAPALNDAFVESNPTTRVFAVVESPGAGIQPQTLLFQIFNKVDALRPMPYFGTPSI